MTWWKSAGLSMVIHSWTAANKRHKFTFRGVQVTSVNTLLRNLVVKYWNQLSKRTMLCAAVLGKERGESLNRCPVSYTKRTVDLTEQPCSLQVPIQIIPFRWCCFAVSVPCLATQFLLSFEVLSRVVKCLLISSFLFQSFFSLPLSDNSRVFLYPLQTNFVRLAFSSNNSAN